MLLVQSNLTEESCWEAREEFLDVARDLDPTVRLLFALAMRSWELSNFTAALSLFSLLSEAGAARRLLGVEARGR